MDEGQSATGPEVAAGEEVSQQERTPEQVQKEIEQTRAELGDAVAELAAKTDVKAQARHAIDDVKTNVAAKTSELKDTVTTKRDDVAAAAKASAPDSAGEAGERLAAHARQNRGPLIVAGAFAAGVVIGMRFRR